MRLICPNCGAQYEVADDVIPQDGRDVQCSNCAHTWFKSHDASDEEDDVAVDVVADPAPDLDDADDETPWGADDYAPKPVTPTKVTPKKTTPVRQELDPAIADILREEAAREAAARRAEAQAIESQPDLGLDSAEPAPDQRSVEAQERMADRKGEPMPAPVTPPSRAAIAAASRGDLLPDIEEINSSLRSESERGAGFTDLYAEPETQKRGASIGFIGVLLILAILTAVYIFAPKIQEMVPAVSGPLTAYVETVDAGRLWLDEQLRRGLDAMTSNDVEQAPDAASGPDAPALAVITDAPEIAPISE